MAWLRCTEGHRANAGAEEKRKKSVVNYVAKVSVKLGERQRHGHETAVPIAVSVSRTVRAVAMITTARHGQLFEGACDCVRCATKRLCGGGRKDGPAFLRERTRCQDKGELGEEGRKGEDWIKKENQGKEGEAG